MAQPVRRIVVPFSGRFKVLMTLEIDSEWSRHRSGVYSSLRAE
jgi:hypothetical protein